jgi:hypothetical protein
MYKIVMNKLKDELIGSWVTEEEDSNVVFSFSKNGDIYEISGYDRSDGEAFDIQDVNWDGTSLSFVAVMPSTGFRSKNVFKLAGNGKAQLSLTIYETWKKIESPPATYRKKTDSSLSS